MRKEKGLEELTRFHLNMMINDNRLHRAENLSVKQWEEKQELKEKRQHSTI
ncbi:hypothetical protein [Mechercharimyces sp. CAU 1602]|uniref:hypothetical protein n=1 Tax=Mechercharimyces sp. CAU 1602 TaxID=2973933 RepID=UPI0021632969|nr:hypothetical protein [Mechercharimyces sp. CAU 1602]MCS1352421.1 hypothetical protein [Mechercharimyces sp. CAU 1602]